jgi:hypothetical protein
MPENCIIKSSETKETPEFPTCFNVRARFSSGAAMEVKESDQNVKFFFGR